MATEVATADNRKKGKKRRNKRMKRKLLQLQHLGEAKKYWRDYYLYLMGGLSFKVFNEFNGSSENFLSIHFNRRGKVKLARIFKRVCGSTLIEESKITVWLLSD